MAVWTGSIASKGDAQCKSAHLSSFGNSSFQLTRVTASSCAWRRRWAGGSPTQTVVSIGAKGARRKDRDGATGLRDAPLCQKRPPLRARRASSWLARTSSKQRGERASLRDASSWLGRASPERDRARASQEDASSWLERASPERGRARASQEDASSWLGRASSNRARSRLSSFRASFKRSRARERPRRASSRLGGTFFGLARPALHGGCASSKLEDARESEAALFFLKK
jgi:hypothetical protein